jgi:glycosyltransferase involved in cell wall biosynthesis
MSHLGFSTLLQAINLKYRCFDEEEARKEVEVVKGLVKKPRSRRLSDFSLGGRFAYEEEPKVYKEVSPSISIVIPTYNEEDNIKTCLDALFRQKYPLDLLEIIIVDNMSTDRTVEVAKHYTEAFPTILIICNEIAKDAEISKMLGLRKAKGELFLYIDADIEIVGDDWLYKLAKPLIENRTLTGSFPRFVPKPGDAALGRYLRYHPLELDPIFQFFCTEIEDTVIEDKQEYQICEFHPPKIPPIGICLYRRKILMRTIGIMEKFMDIDVPVILSKNGYSRFAYVPSCGIYHVNIKSLKDLVRKRLRNIEKIYLPTVENREFKYFSLKSKGEVFRIIVWIIYANLFIPELVMGIVLAIKNKDAACMYRPIVSFLLTDTIVYAFVKDEKGRRLILNKLDSSVR